MDILDIVKIWVFSFNWTILVNFYIFTNLIFLYIFKIIVKLIMTSSWFDFGLTSKTLNLSLLQFNERFGSKNLAISMTNIFLVDFLCIYFMHPKKKKKKNQHTLCTSHERQDYIGWVKRKKNNLFMLSIRISGHLSIFAIQK